jgi:hypothetical protein
MLKKIAMVALLAALLPVRAATQATDPIRDATRALGAEGLNSITYSGMAWTGNFGQSKNIAGPLAITTITNYSRAIDFTRPASRAAGTTMPPQVPGGPLPQQGNFNQNITPANAGWTQQLEIWLTPWGFLKGAAANNATVRAQRIGNGTYNVATWMTPQKSPSGQSYRVVGYINSRNLVERVETWVEHAVMGDLHVEATYSDYRDYNGLKVPAKMMQRRAGIQTFDGTIVGASANPANIAELLTPPAPAAGQRGGGQQAAGAGRGGAPAAPPAVASERMAEGVYRITGGYVALAVEFRDHIVIIEGGQSEARGLAVMAEARRVIPNKNIRYVINTHAHFDHSSGLAPFAAEGITIITHQNNRDFLERALSGPRTLVGDNLSKTNRRLRIEGVSDKRVLADGNRAIELHHVQNLEHADGMLVAYLPQSKILLTADFNITAANAAANPSIPMLIQNVQRLGLDFDSFVMVHAPNPDRPLTRQDLLAVATTRPN